MTTPTTTPVIGLGAITPASVAATGTVAGSNLSGTNTGDETQATIKTKLGPATTSTDGYLTLADWNTFNNKASTTNSWSTTGNIGTNSGINYIGTKDNASLLFKTKGIQGIVLDSLGNVGVGNAPVFDPGILHEKFLVDAGSTATNPTPAGAYNLMSVKGYLDGYVQLNIENNSPGVSASADIVASNDVNTESIGFVDLGINSSGNTSTGVLGGASTGYLYSTGNDFAIGNGTSAKNLNFFTTNAGALTERMRILGTGNVGIGTTNPLNKLSVVGTNPLYLSGVQSGSVSDSLLTISAGVIKMVAPSTLAVANAWSLTGNATTNPSTNFLGTTDAQPVLFKVNNQQIARLEQTSFAFGAGAGTNTATNSMALGYGAVLGSGVTNAISIGSAATASISNTFAIGNSAVSNPNNGDNAFAIGNAATVASTASFVVGPSASTASSISNAFAIGKSAIVNGSNSMAIGNNASIGTGAASAIAIGDGVQANATGSVSIGAATTAVGTGSTNSIAIGTGASIGSSLTNSTAIGANASTTFSNTLILGDRGNQLLSVGIGSEAFSPSTREKLLVDAGTVVSNGYISVIGGKGNTNNYLQTNIQNRSSGSIASTDVVATNDAGTELNQTGFVDMGINSSGNTTTGVLGGNSTAYLYSTGNDFAIGNNTSTKSLNFFTTDAGGSAERMRIDGTGKVGIGTNAPTTDLTVYQSTSAGNAKGIRLTGNSIGGSNTGSGFALALGFNQTNNKQLWIGDADYVGNSAGTFSRYAVGNGNVAILDAISGDNTVRRPISIGVGGDANSGVVFGADNNAASPSSFVWDNGSMAIGSGYRSNAAPSNGLLVQGNTGIGASVFDANNPEKLLVDAGAGSYNVISGRGNLNNYLQLNIKNANAGTAASSDVVATNDAGTEANGLNFIDMGVNSSGNTSTGVLGGANTAYLYSTGNDLAIGNSVAFKNLVLFTGGLGSSNERMRIDGSGNVGINTTAVSSTFEVNGSIGSAISTTTVSLTLGGNDHTLIVTGGTPTITLPSPTTASSHARREYVIVNDTNASVAIAGFTYISFTAAATSTLAANSAITIQSDGVNWYRIR